MYMVSTWALSPLPTWLNLEWSISKLKHTFSSSLLGRAFALLSLIQSTYTLLYPWKSNFVYIYNTYFDDSLSIFAKQENILP